MMRSGLVRSAIALIVAGSAMAMTACTSVAPAGLSAFHRAPTAEDRLPDGASPIEDFADQDGRYLGRDDYFRFYAARFVVPAGRPSICLVIADDLGAETSCQQFLPIEFSSTSGNERLQYQLSTTDPGEDWIEVAQDVWTYWPEID